MAQFNVFDYSELRGYLTEAIFRNCFVEMGEDGLPAFHFHGISGIDVVVGQTTIELLSQDLRIWTSLNGCTAPQALAELMAEVAVIVSHADLKVFALSGERAQLQFLKRKISSDFALICALSLARSRGYPSSLERLTLEAIYPALMARDEDLLSRKFREYLVAARPGIRADHARRSPSGTNRVLSAKSYWNLVSAAETGHWNDSVKQRLIEEYLSPAPHPCIVPYSNDVSGDEWRQLYEWIYELDGRVS